MVDVCGTGFCNVYRTVVCTEYATGIRRFQIIFPKRSRCKVADARRILFYNNMGIARRMDIMAVMEHTT